MFNFEVTFHMVQVFKTKTTLMSNFTVSLTAKLKSWRVEFFFIEIHENRIGGDCFVRKLKNPTFKKPQHEKSN